MTIRPAQGLTMLVLATLAVGGCGVERPAPPAGDDAYEVSGTVTYRERIMLPTPATVELSVRDGAGETTADTSLVAEHQPPVPFVVRVPRARVDSTVTYFLTARLSAEDGNLVWATRAPIPVLTMGAPRELELVLDSERRPEAPAGEPWREARERGVTFRAVGQEPGWMLDLYGRARAPQRLVLSVDYGERTYDFSQLIRDEDGDGNPRYRASSDTVRVEVVIEDRLCHDVMSGEEFEAVVLVRLNDTTFHGCGRELV